MKKKLEVQTILLLLCALLVAGSWIGLEVAKDSLGVWTEPAELHFTTDNLLGLGPRSELRCAGAVVGHVRKVTTQLVNGQPQFDIVAGVGKQFAAWKFATPATVALGVVQSVVSPSSITLEIATTGPGVQPRKPGEAQPLDVIPLVQDTSNNAIAAITDRINKTIDQFTTVQKGHAEPATLELADAIHNLNAMTASLDQTVGKNGKVDTALDALNADLQHLKDTIDTTTKTISDLDAGVDTSLRQMNGLVSETTVTMTTLHGTLERVGDTFVGRMLIARPKTAASPAPAKTPRDTH